jgi:hypothetical protein
MKCTVARQRATRKLREVSGMDIPAAGSVGFLPPELLHMLSTARRIIDLHVNDHGSCAYCGAFWPCQRAQQADFALAVL